MPVSEFFPLLLCMAGTTYILRMLPFVFFRKKITNRRLKAFFDYIPYAVLTAMTVPAIFYCCDNPVCAAIGFVTALILAFFENSLIVVAIGAAAAVLLSSFVF